MQSKRGCSIEGCQGKHKGHGWCSLHYQKWQHHGDPLGGRTYHPGSRCSVDGCQEPHWGRGLCQPHYNQWYRRTHRQELATYMHQWHLEHRDSQLERGRARRELHREEAIEAARLWREQHRERHRAVSRQWGRDHRGERKVYEREWRSRNRDRTKIYWHRREAKKAENGGTFTAEEWRALCEEYGNRCLCCGLGFQLHADHVVPLSMGGSTDIGNIQPLCRSCNSRKGTKTIDYR